MGILRHTAGAGVLAVALVACGSEAGPPPVRSGPTSPSEAATSAAPTLSAMPDGAKSHTNAGAEAFLRYYVRVVNYAQQTLDVAPLETLTSPDCTGCKGGINALRKNKRLGVTTTGGKNSVGAMETHPDKMGSTTYTQIFFELSNSRQTETFPDGHTKTYDAGKVRARILLQPEPVGWKVKGLDVFP